MTFESWLHVKQLWKSLTIDLRAVERGCYSGSYVLMEFIPTQAVKEPFKLEPHAMYIIFQHASNQRKVLLMWLEMSSIHLQDSGSRPIRHAFVYFSSVSQLIKTYPSKWGWSPECIHCPIIIWSIRRQFMPNEVNMLNSHHGPGWSLPRINTGVDRMTPDVWHEKTTVNQPRERL
ncbi:hypothetical protein VNO77_04468 [Canavalia gladiata]|uniref:Uncharacterized protein n=1 Tax=Canavalia gladiata TaxID=3824 RepID=A0AAN9R7T3_CANGL